MLFQVLGGVLGGAFGGEKQGHWFWPPLLRVLAVLPTPNYLMDDFAQLAGFMDSIGFVNVITMHQLAPPTKRRRDEFSASENLCEHCTAKCCHYFALAIDQPVNRRDFDYLRWYLLHDRASIFVDDDTWYLLVHTTCKHLLDDFRCGIYETRPQICREYTTNECEFEDDWCYEKYFETPEQIDEYADALFGPQFADPHRTGKNSLRSRRPTSLPLA